MPRICKSNAFLETRCLFGGLGCKSSDYPCQQMKRILSWRTSSVKTWNRPNRISGETITTYWMPDSSTRILYFLLENMAGNRRVNRNHAPGRWAFVHECQKIVVNALEREKRPKLLQKQETYWMPVCFSIIRCNLSKN